MKIYFMLGGIACIVIQAGNFDKQKENTAELTLRGKVGGHKRNSSRSCSDLLDTPYGKKMAELKKDKRRLSVAASECSVQDPLEWLDQEKTSINQKRVAIQNELLELRIKILQEQQDAKGVNKHVLDAKKELLQAARVLPETKSRGEQFRRFIWAIMKDLDDTLNTFRKENHD